MIIAILLALVAQLVLAEPSQIRNCGRNHRKRLLQITQTSIDNSAIGTALQSDPSQNGTLVQTLQVDLLQELCIVTFNSAYLSQDQQLVPPDRNLRSSTEACCVSCAETPGCNAWQWCPRPEGCPLNSTGEIFPYRGCQLLQIYPFSPYVTGFSPVQDRGPDVPYIAGAPFNLTLPQLPGYSINPGADLGTMYDYPCGASSVPTSCMVMGPAEDIGSLCSGDPRCMAFVYFPEGIAFDGSGPVGVLKSGNGTDDTISPAALQLNPTSVTYIKIAKSIIGNNNTNPTNAKVSSARSNSSSYTGAIIGGAIGGAVLLGLIGLLIGIFVARNRKRGLIVTAQKKNRNVGQSDSPTSSQSPPDSVDGRISEQGAGGKILLRQDSPPSVVTESVSDYAMHNSYDQIQAHQIVVVSELTANNNNSKNLNMRNPKNSSISQGSLPPGSSALDLLEAFSQMYAHCPVVDPKNLAEMLEDEEAALAAEREEAEDRLPVSSTATLTTTTTTKQDAEATSDDSSGMDIGTAAEQHSAPPFNGSKAPSLDAWTIRPEDVEVCRRPDGSWWQLGTGAFGTVYKGLYRGTESVAIKVLNRLEESRHIDAFSREVALLQTLRDRHIVHFLGACLDGPQGTAMFVTELMELGDLWRAIPARDADNERIFAWHRRGKRVMTDVAKGLKYLHSKRIVHFDLKSANILLSRAGTAKLADIGMARVLNNSYLSKVSSVLGTFAWSAPEVLAGRRCGIQSDIYSWGIVLWEVCTGEAPSRGELRPLRSPEDCPPEVVELFHRCVAENPDDRPTIDEILSILEK